MKNFKKFEENIRKEYDNDELSECFSFSEWIDETGYRIYYDLHEAYTRQQIKIAFSKIDENIINNICSFL